ncbi:alpha/beta fold hydrolase [Phycobacter azelaicus]|jgi:pimeloyl-ACP methyl ester carboxylesterase|uniref:alpha/beta fold hydrolase n=1 Tax=Phycobacter azelaicus TaxID=2668075 RepID=UPI001866FC0D|nr:alpha/beta hydrolase [Phycobacter azelaicus]
MEFSKAVETHGNFGAEPLVLLPGMMCDARIFTPQIEALSAHVPITVAPLLGGDRIEAIAAHILNMLPERFALAGLSMGGIIAMEILRRAPGRVSRLCLMATTPLAETPAQAAEREPLIIGARTGRLGEMLEKALPAECLAPGAGRAEILNKVQQMGQAFGSDVFVNQNRALQRRMDQQAAARRCHVPALILCGEFDRLTPVKRHELLASLIPQATFEVISGAGHLPSLEQPELVTRAMMSWLAAPAEQQHPS